MDGATLSQYLDLRGQPEVTVHMRGGERFDPARVIMSPGTTITWTNDEDNLHFVNTDPHPSHNVLSDLNSSVIRQGESYSYTFVKPGAWGYHCSAHYNLGMTAQVIVI